VNSEHTLFKMYFISFSIANTKRCCLGKPLQVTYNLPDAAVIL